MADITKTVKPSGGDYTALETCLADNEQDMTSTDGVFTAQIDGTWSADDTINVDIDGWTTDATRYVRIYTETAARHDGTAGSGYVLAPTGGGHVVTLNQEYTRIEGLEIEMTTGGGASDEGVRLQDDFNNSVFDKCIIWSEDAGNDQDGVYVFNDTGLTTPSTVSFFNSIFYGWTRAGINFQFYTNETKTINGVIRNCTFMVCGKNGEGESGGIHGRKDAEFPTMNLTVYNSIFADTVSTFDDISTSGTRAGDINWTGDYNATSDISGTLVDDGTNGFQSATVEETAQGAGTWIIVVDKDDPFDWHLLDDASNDMKGTGSAAQQPPSPYAADIDYETRKSPPDIGADDIPTAAAAAFVPRVTIF